MNRYYLIIVAIFSVKLIETDSLKPTNVNKDIEIDAVKKPALTPIEASSTSNKTQNKTKLARPKGKGPVKNVKVPGSVPKKSGSGTMITPETVQQWAQTISTKLLETEQHVTKRDLLIKGFSDAKYEMRSGAAIVDKMAESLNDILVRRTEAAEKIMRAAEDISREPVNMPCDYQFYNSVDLDVLKPKLEKSTSIYENQTTCENFGKLKLKQSKHFGNANVTLDYSSVHVSPEVFSCENNVLQSIYWSEKLLSTFKENYAKDATLDNQYFCSAKGFLRHYPAANWDSMFQLHLDREFSVYDCRLRPWYVSAEGAPRDILILLDASGSMTNSTNKEIAETFIKTFLNVLTDDDQVNVLRFNVIVESPISCFNEKLVPANHINAAAMISAMKDQKMKNETKMEKVLESAVKMLKDQRADKTRQVPCQQAIVLLTDSLYGNFSELMRDLDPENSIRLFVFWLHDPNGLRDNTLEYGEGITCERDGYFAEFICSFDVTEKVMKVLRVLERPLVAQRKERFKVFSDVIAHVEDPRRHEYQWIQKERQEQMHRYNELRLNRDGLLSSARLLEDFMYQESLDKKGQYYEGEDTNYRLQISVAVPVFDHITSQNITRSIKNKKTQLATRTYPVNQLLGVAGVDIPIDHLKLILPYDELGGGGALFLIDHRGNVVIHDNLTPLFDGDILKPGYRTVDMIDIEQPALAHPPRHYPKDWLEFRTQVIITEKKGNKTMYVKNVFEGGMRVLLEKREYHWRRIQDHYTAVVVLPMYNRRHVVFDDKFTQSLAEEAFKALSDYPEFSIHPDWLYCRHVEASSFDSKERELQHFLRRRRDEANFPLRHLNHYYSPIEPSLFEKTYQCNENLMVSVSKEAISTTAWAKGQDAHTNEICNDCPLGSVTSFFASENGLTRWQRYFAINNPDPPDGIEWPKGPTETWYKRAVATPDTLVIHAPVRPVQRFRNSFIPPPPLTTRTTWLTAARALNHASKGTIGVTGYHFLAKPLEAIVDLLTNKPSCDEDDHEGECSQQCNGEDWSCMVIDDAGWIVASGTPQEDPPAIRQHLATLHPVALSVLLNASVFKLHWVHDYQAVCLPYKPRSSGAAQTLTTLFHSLQRAVNLITVALRSIIASLTLLNSVHPVQSDTQAEKDKRRRRLKKDFEREKYESLHDDRVLVNRTSYAACDRSRPLYEFQVRGVFTDAELGGAEFTLDGFTPAAHDWSALDLTVWTRLFNNAAPPQWKRTFYKYMAMEAFKRPSHACNWPLAGAIVPNTNLIFLAVYNLCPYVDPRPIPDPMVKEPVIMTGEYATHKEVESQLACWRYRTPLDGRPPRTPCYPHNYSQEAGYRQCGPWEYITIEDDEE